MYFCKYSRIYLFPSVIISYAITASFPDSKIRFRFLFSKKCIRISVLFRFIKNGLLLPKWPDSRLVCTRCCNRTWAITNYISCPYRLIGNRMFRACDFDVPPVYGVDGPLSILFFLQFLQLYKLHKEGETLIFQRLSGKILLFFLHRVLPFQMQFCALLCYNTGSCF